MMLSLLLPLTLAAAPSADFLPNDIADARCVAIFALIADGTEPTAKQAGTFGTIYFVGKLVGRNPRIDIAAILRAVADDTQKNADDYRRTCAAELQAVGQKMTIAGKALSDGR